jgi:hypothetical protein
MIHLALLKKKIKNLSMTKIIEYENPRQEISILDESNPTAIVNKIQSEILLEAIRKMPIELLEKDPRSLNKLVRPSPSLNRVRLNFWNSYVNAVRTGRMFNVTDIVAGVMTKDAFFSTIVSTPKNLAWVLCPVMEYKCSLEEALDVGIRKIREMMEVEVVDENGVLDTKAAAIVLKAFQMIDERVNGGITQKIESKTLNITKNIPSQADGNNVMLDEELRSLKRQFLESKMKEDPGFGGNDDAIEVSSES